MKQDGLVFEGGNDLEIIQISKPLSNCPKQPLKSN